MTYEKALIRVKKLLALAENAGSDHEAAQAAAQAAQLMAEYQLTEAELRLTENVGKAEPIVQLSMDGQEKLRRRVAWQSTIASAVAESFGCKMFWWGPAVRFFGRESAVQASNYTSLYLLKEVERLCEEAWSQTGRHKYMAVHKFDRHTGETVVISEPVNTKAWRNAFRVGAANVISRRLGEQKDAKKAERKSAVAAAQTARVAKTGEPIKQEALILVQKEEHEVEDAYKDYSKGWRSASPLGSTSSSSGYAAGKSAGGRIQLGGGRAGLGAGQGRLKP